MTGIPKRLGHIWIGPKPAPAAWMDTWPVKHPDWEYTVYDNDFLLGHPFRLRKHINEYFWRGLYAGVQDMMRYEILYRYGGFMADADAICLHPVDELLDGPRAYTVYDRPASDKFRGVCPFLACEPGNPLIGAIIDAIAAKDPAELRKAEVSTGNRFLMSMIRSLEPDDDALRIWPTHYFVPWQKSDPDDYYDGPDRVYAEQKWATSTYAYNQDGGPSETVLSRAEIASRANSLMTQLAGGAGRPLSPLRGQDRDLRARVSVMETAAEAILKDAAFQSDIADLNGALVAALENGGRSDQPVHGMHFYRHMQNAPLVGSKLRTRSDRIRARLICWLGQAQNALLVGIDAGHLPLAALCVNSDVTIHAIDSAKWRRDKDRNPPATHLYVPAAADWLATRFPDRLTAKIGIETDLLTAMTQDPRNHEAFDLLVLPGSDVIALKIIQAARPLLSRDAVVVCASTEHLTGATQVDRLLMQDIAYAPMEQEDFGASNGSLSAFRLKPIS